MNENETKVPTVDDLIDQSLSPFEVGLAEAEAIRRAIYAVNDLYKHFVDCNSCSCDDYLSRWDEKTVPKTQYKRIAENRVKARAFKNLIASIETLLYVKLRYAQKVELEELISK